MLDCECFQFIGLNRTGQDRTGQDRTGQYKMNLVDQKKQIECAKKIGIRRRRTRVGTVPAPLDGAACIQKLFFQPSDYHIKST